MKKLALFVCFLLNYIQLTHADECVKYLDEIEAVCSTEYFSAKNNNDLSSYLNSGKYKDGRLLNLKIDYNLNSAILNFSIPCGVKIAGKRTIKITKDDLCIEANNFESEANIIDVRNNGRIFVSTKSNLKIRASVLNSESKIILKSSSKDPIDGGIIISSLSILKSKFIEITSESNLALSPLSSMLSKGISLNGKNCEIHEATNSSSLLEWISKKFNPNFNYIGSCKENPISNDLKILNSSINDQQAMNLKLSQNDDLYKITWLIDDTVTEETQLDYDFVFPGRRFVRAIVYKEGFFRKISKLVEIPVRKLFADQNIVFKFDNVSGQTSLISKFNNVNVKFEKSNLDETLYTSFTNLKPSDKITIHFPTLNYKTTAKVIPNPTISNPDIVINEKLNFITKAFDQLDPAIPNREAYIKIVEKISSHLSTLTASQKRNIAQYLDIYHSHDLVAQNHYFQNFIKKLSEQFIIGSANADWFSEIFKDVLAVKSVKKFLEPGALIWVSNMFISAGSALIVLSTLSKDPVSSQELFTAGVILDMAGYGALVLARKKAAELLADIHFPISKSLRISTATVRSQEDNFLELSARFRGPSPLQWGEEKTWASDNVVYIVESMNNKINEANKIFNHPLLKQLIGLVPGLPGLTYSPLNLIGRISAEYIHDIVINNSQFGGVTIQSFENIDGVLKLNIKSNRTQNIGLFFNYFCGPLGINYKYFYELKVEAPPKAIINYSTNELEVKFDANDPSNPNAVNLTYEWDFGDGKKQITSSKTISHKYESTGIYNVKLKVTDQDGVSSDDSTVLDLSGINYSLFMQVNVLGTYLFVDEVGGYQENGNFIKDRKVSPTVLDLTQLYAQIKLREGDKIVLQAAGLHIPGSAWGNVAEGLVAVFLGTNGIFLAPGPDGEFNSVPTPPTYPKYISTDIPQDFYVPTLGSTTVQIPVGAKGIAFTPNDSYFSDNLDPDNDYGVRIKITIIKKPEIPFN